MTSPDKQLTEVAVVGVSPWRVAAVLMVIVAIFALAAVVLALPEIDADDGLSGQALDSLHRLFNPFIEANLATWVATALLLSGALLTDLVARVKIDAHDPTRCCLHIRDARAFSVAERRRFIRRSKAEEVVC